MHASEGGRGMERNRGRESKKSAENRLRKYGSLSAQTRRMELTFGSSESLLPNLLATRRPPEDNERTTGGQREENRRRTGGQQNKSNRERTREEPERQPEDKERTTGREPEHNQKTTGEQGEGK